MDNNEKIPCERCGRMILPNTAKKTSGICMPCFKGKARSPEENLEKKKALKKGENLYMVHIEGKNLKPTESARNTIVAASNLKLDSYEFSVSVNRAAMTKDIAKEESINQILHDPNLINLITNEDFDPLEIVSVEAMKIPNTGFQSINAIQGLGYLIYCNNEQVQTDNSWEDSEDDIYEGFAAGEPDKKAYKKLKKFADKKNEEAAERLISHFAEAEDESLVSFKEVEKYSLMLAKSNNSMGVGMLAELYADDEFEKYDLQKAYFWSFIAYSIDGYNTKYQNTNKDNSYYAGVDGDFRNEPLVIKMVKTIGENKIKSIDIKASRWISENLLNN